jgi:hypothetical protein
VEDEEEVTISGSRIHSKGTAKDYLRPETQLSGFLQHVRVPSCFDKFNGLTGPLIEFHARIHDIAVLAADVEFWCSPR